ncbi:YfcC family protein [Flavobacterium okayamense]|uniref:C4-dicarboxylate transporter n=1 Tax=Flavobacterium okayamense TaxID=2830782 RepID=A0ABN6HYI2_9FLAO|nr:YfcC family protein [Flavobacterium okayamense]BCY29429.1 C4-dicarboxylate transporter [Flavobacterium okayamense]
MKLKFPSAQTILLLITALTVLLTWFIPSGKYDTLAYDKEANGFVLKGKETSLQLKASQQTLDSLAIKIPLDKFTSGDIWKPINIPDTFHYIENEPQGLVSFLKAPIKGIIQAADIIFFVLILGGTIGIMNYSGAFDAGITSLAQLLKGKEFLLIIIITTLIALGGTTFGLAEETIAFYPILIPVFLRAKYDAMVPLAAVYIGSSVGTMISTVNPFSTIIASNVAGINWTTGLTSRIIFLTICTIVCIAYIMWYGKKVQKDASKSIIFNQKKEIEQHYFYNKTTNITLNIPQKIALTIFLLCFMVMIYGVSQLEWWFEEMTAVFLTGSIIIGFVLLINEKKFVTEFIKGAGELLGVALIIGIARGVSVIMEEGMIIDTILYHASTITSGMNKGIFANMMMLIYSGLSFFIPSSSGMAVLTMPIFAPLADTVGIGREVIVDAYQLGQGLFAFINPTGLILASLAIVNVGYDKWLKFVMPLIGILLVLIIGYLTLISI